MQIITSQRKFIFLCLFCISVSVVISGCAANTSIVEPISESDALLTQRWLALGATIVLGFIQLGILAAKNPQSARIWAKPNISSIMIIPLIWTKIGEWGYMISNWLFKLWNPLVLILGFLNGISGNTGLALYWIVLFGFVFPSPDLFAWAVLPILAGLIVNIFLLCLLPSATTGNNTGGS